MGIFSDVEDWFREAPDEEFQELWPGEYRTGMLSVKKVEIGGHSAVQIEITDPSLNPP
jgi:hypothetical protein